MSESSSGPLEGLTDEQTLREFLDDATPPSEQDAADMVAEAIELLSSYYVHLPLKRALHGVDPVQRLKNVQERLRDDTLGVSLANWAVTEVLTVFNSLRDLHTSVVLPEPWRSRVAFLPFLVEEYESDGSRHYLVTKVRDAHPHFVPGVELVEWNWIPMERAVALNADRNGGSNEDARHARGVESLAYRWLGGGPPPDEHQVVVGYRTGSSQKIRRVRFQWKVARPPRGGASDEQAHDGGRATDAAALHLAIDKGAENGRRTKRALYAGGGSPPSWFTWRQSELPDALRWAILPEPQGGEQGFGYLRIHSFDVDPADAFVQEVVRLLTMPEMQATRGLIVDVRGNGGGVMDAGERILQLLTPAPITPEPVQCLSSPAMYELARVPDGRLSAWEGSIAEAMRTGSQLSRALPMTPVDACNDIGQRYQAPVALVVDALSYSTTDSFAAGFQDHRIGPVIGPSGTTGAGGANVWPSYRLDALREGRDPVEAEPPPGDRWTFQLALRRTLRVGANAGRPLEDLGVNVVRWPVTRDDLLDSNRDLLAHAMSLLENPVILAKLPRRGLLSPRSQGIAADHLEFECDGLDRVDVALDDRPYVSIDVPATTTVTIGSERRTWRQARLDGYAEGHLAASCRITSPAAGDAGDG